MPSVFCDFCSVDVVSFYYTAKVLGLLDVHGLPFLSALRTKGEAYCSMERAAAVKAFPGADDDEIDKTCFCAAWLLAIVQEGFSLGQFSNFKVIRDIEGEGNIDWALGFLVAEVPSINNGRTGPLQGAANGEETSTVSNANECRLFVVCRRQCAVMSVYDVASCFVCFAPFPFSSGGGWC